MSFTKEIKEGKKERKGGKEEREERRGRKGSAGKGGKGRKKEIKKQWWNQQAVGAGDQPSLESLSGRPPLLSSSTLSYCDLFSLQWLHMSPSKEMVPNSMNAALLPPCLWNHSKLSSGCVHQQERLRGPSWAGRHLQRFKIFLTKKRRGNLAAFLKNSINNSIFFTEALAPGD